MRISDFGFSRKRERIVKPDIRNSQSAILTMSEPEISHRCTSCGVSIRGHALFCPQCGEPFARSTEIPRQIEDGHPAPAAEANRNTAPQLVNGEAAGRPDVGPLRRRSDRSGGQTTQGSPTVQPAARPAAKQDNSAATKSADPRREVAGRTGPAGDKARKRIQRATTAARDALEDNVRPQVERIRHASTVVLEEASYDPSLRFILIAAALFVLFVVLLVISKVI